MKKNLGFTLAEVLITLGIIGVVAALTTPALVKNSGHAKIGPSLAKFVNTWELASERMMTEEGVSKLTNTVAPSSSNNTVKIVENLTKYMIATPLPDVEFEYYLPPGVLGGKYQKGNVFQMKDGSIFHIYDNGHNFTMDDRAVFNGPFKGIIGELHYDINGLSGNNQIGREIFVFGIDDSGMLVPYGGNMHRSFYKALDIDAEGSHYATFPYSCDIKATFDVDSNGKPKDSVKASHAILNAYSCTGAIADNGWKVPY